MALTDEQEKALRDELAKEKGETDKWKGLSRQHEDRSKANFEELEKLKASKLSDEEKKAAAETASAQKLATFEKQLADERLARMRAETAAAKGLTPAQAKRLNGTTQEELEADADDILEHFKPADTTGEPDTGKTRPVTRPRALSSTLAVSGGGDPTVEAGVDTDPAKLAADLPRF
ncbi:MAG: hypothetical protein Q8K63_05380 [Acidimicrobiales bacterium]|nr:hypothetical protein [Acidimicrobiales bacterium]